MCLTWFAFFLNVYRHASDTFDDEPHACFQFQEQRFQEYNHKHNSNAENKLGFVSKICNQTKIPFYLPQSYCQLMVCKKKNPQ